MQKFNKQQRYIIVSELASWYSPEELQKLFGINYCSIYHYCNKYGIPKYRESVSKHKQDFLNEYDIWLSQRREEALVNVKTQLEL